MLRIFQIIYYFVQTSISVVEIIANISNDKVVQLQSLNIPIFRCYECDSKSLKKATNFKNLSQVPLS